MTNYGSRNINNVQYIKEDEKRQIVKIVNSANKFQLLDARNIQEEQIEEKAMQKLDSVKVLPPISNSHIKSEKKMNLTWTDLEVRTAEKKGCFKKKEQIIQDSENGEILSTNKRKLIIDKASGYAKSKEVLAIMGASGAGKTTLLNALTLRNRGNFKIDGNIKCNGSTMRSYEDISSVSGYVQQDDLFIGFLTVREHLIFQAMLRMKITTPKEERIRRVDEILNDLNLTKCSKNLIGLFGRKGISGGEKRRLAFASEIITDPAILFCDEPTSGLDSFMAVAIAELMQDLAKKGKTIICTIHQPSSEIFNMFDKLCLMVEGKVAYFGEVPGASKFFNDLNLEVPNNYNPADFFIKNLAVAPNKREECIENIKKICAAYEKSEARRKKLEIIDSLNEVGLKNTPLQIKKESFYKSNPLTQLRWLLWRNSLAIIREPFSFIVQVVQAFIVSLLFGSIYFQLKYSVEGIGNINGFIFLCLTNNGFSTLFFVVASFPLELPVFIREHQNGMYRVFTYYIAKIFIELLTFVIVPVIFMSIAYYMAGLNPEPGRFFVCTALIVLTVQCSLAFGTFLSAIAPNTTIALAFAGPVLVPLMIFSGFLLSFEAIPNYFIWLRYFSWFSYANENLMLNQWGGLTNLTREGCNSVTENCAFDGNDVIKLNKWKPQNELFNWLMLGALTIFYRVITYISLVARTYLISN